MARIQNISADQLRRLFQAPEIAQPQQQKGELAGVLELSEALKNRQLAEKQRESKIAEIEANLAKAEKEKQLGEALQPAQPRLLGTAMGQVPTSQIASPIDEMAGTTGPSMLEQDQIQKDQEAIGLAAQVDPMKEYERRVKASEKAKGGEKLEFGSKGFQQGQVMVTDASGKPQTLGISFDVATGQYVNPFTNQPIKDINKELNGLLPRGYALNFNVVGTDENNMPVQQESKTGNYFVNGEPYTGIVYPRLDKAPSGIVDSLASLKKSVQLLDIIESKFAPDLTGPLVGRATSLSSSLGTLGGRRTEFLGYLRDYQNAMIKAITGAQMSEPEAKRLMGQMPNINENPEAFLAKLKSSRVSASSQLASKYDSLKKSNYITKDAISEERARQIVENAMGLPTSIGGSTGGDLKSVLKQLLQKKR